MASCAILRSPKITVDVAASRRDFATGNTQRLGLRCAQIRKQQWMAARHISQRRRRFIVEASNATSQDGAGSQIRAESERKEVYDVKNLNQEVLEDEEPYRTLPSGRKVYLKELDVLDFLERGMYMTPLDPSRFNIAAYLWKKLGDIPPERRLKFMELLEPRHLQQMWKFAGMRYSDLDLFPESTTAATMMPTSAAEGAVFFQGLVNGVPWPVGWLKHFAKAFFVSGDGKLYGRVIGGGSLLEGLSGRLFPLYLRVRRTSSVVATGEPCELAFQYDTGHLHLRETGVPEGFPSPATPPWPFSDKLIDYIRPVGPGIFVGQSWQEGVDLEQIPRQFLGEFIMVLKEA